MPASRLRLKRSARFRNSSRSGHRSAAAAHCILRWHNLPASHHFRVVRAIAAFRFPLVRCLRARRSWLPTWVPLLRAPPPVAPGSLFPPNVPAWACHHAPRAPLPSRRRKPGRRNPDLRSRPRTWSHLDLQLRLPPFLERRFHRVPRRRAPASLRARRSRHARPLLALAPPINPRHAPSFRRVRIWFSV